MAPAFAALLLLALTSARAEILPTVNPNPVTEADNLSIEFVIPGAHLDSCYFTDHQFSRIGNQITIDLTTDRQGDICLQVISDAEVNVPIGQLPPGTYAVTVNHTTLTGVRQPETINFNVTVLPAPPKPRLNGTSQLSFATESGRTYQVMCSPNLSSWSPLGDPIAGNGSPAEVALPGGGGAQFYRVQVTMDGGS